MPNCTYEIQRTQKLMKCVLKCEYNNYCQSEVGEIYEPRFVYIIIRWRLCA